MGVELFDVDGRKDGQPRRTYTRFSEICEAPNIVQFIIFLNIRNTRSYLDLNRQGTAWEWRNCRSQLIWRSIAQSSLLQIDVSEWCFIEDFVRISKLELIFEAGKYCMLFTDIFPNSSVPYSEQYYYRSCCLID